MDRYLSKCRLLVGNSEKSYMYLNISIFIHVKFVESQNIIYGKNKI